MHCKVPLEDSSDQLAGMAHEYCAGTPLQADVVLAQWMQRYARAAAEAPLLYKAAGCDRCNHTGY